MGRVVLGLEAETSERDAAGAGVDAEAADADRPTTEEDADSATDGFDTATGVEADTDARAASEDCLRLLGDAGAGGTPPPE